MDVVASHMGRQQIPATMRTHFTNCFQYSVAADAVRAIGRLIHAVLLKSHPRGIALQNRCPRNIVRHVDGAGRLAVEVAAVAGKGDQVRHEMSPQF